MKSPSVESLSLAAVCILHAAAVTPLLVRRGEQWGGSPSKLRVAVAPAKGKVGDCSPRVIRTNTSCARLAK